MAAKPVFRKKQYEAVAQVISAIDNPADRLLTCRRFTKAFETDNALFDKAKFEKACGVDGLTG